MPEMLLYIVTVWGLVLLALPVLTIYALIRWAKASKHLKGLVARVEAHESRLSGLEHPESSPRMITARRLEQVEKRLDRLEQQAPRSLGEARVNSLQEASATPSVVELTEVQPSGPPAPAPAALATSPGCAYRPPTKRVTGSLDEAAESGPGIAPSTPLDLPAETTTRQEQATTRTSAGRGGAAPAWASDPGLLGDGLRKLKVSDWESLIGRHWLNVLGIVVLVIGVVLLLGYSLRYFGPAGKVATGCVTGIVLLSGGWWLEHLTRYRPFARALLGGGWALLFFTAYAAHNVAAARIIDDPRWAMPVLVAIALGMIAHSFRYRSQVVTGLAYGLAFLAISISPVSGFSLISVALLAASIVGVLRALPWYHLGLGGVIGSYFCFVLWRQSIAFDSAALAEPNVLIGIGILALYWLLFAAMAFVRRPESPQDRTAVLVLGAANGCAFLFFGLDLLVDAADTSSTSAFLLLSGLAFAGLAYLLRRVALSFAFLPHALAAVGLLAASVPGYLEANGIRYDWLALPWALESALVLTLGLRLRELWLRVASYGLAGLAAVALFAVTLQGTPDGRQTAIWMSAPLAIGYFFYSFEVLKARAGKGEVLPQARGVALAFGYCATTLLAALVWIESPRVYVGPLWLVLGLIMFEIGIRTERPHLRRQGMTLLAAAAIAVVGIDVLGQGVPTPLGGSFLWTLVVACALAYHWVPERLSGVGSRAASWPVDEGLAIASGYVGTGLVATLLYLEFPLSQVPAAWIVFGIVLAEIARAASRVHLRVQGLLLGAAAFPLLLLVNLYEVIDVDVERGGLRWLIVGGCALAYHWLSERPSRGAGTGRTRQFDSALSEGASYAGTLVLAILVWVEANAVSVAVCWALIGLVLFEVAGRLERARLHLQTRALVVASFARLFLANFTALGVVAGMSHRLVSVGAVVAILYYLWFWARQSTLRGDGSHGDLTGRTLYSFLAAIALVLLARFELGRADTVIAWSALGLAYLVVAVHLSDRDFRLQSYALFIIAFARSWVTNLTLTGTVLGVSQRQLSTGAVILGLAAATGYCIRHRLVFVELGKRGGRLGLLDSYAASGLALMSAVLLSLLLAYEVNPRWLTIAWTVEAFVLLLLGFVLVARFLRLYGLALALICLGKLVILDLAGMETLFRIFSFILLGVILLLMSLGYARYQNIVKRYL